MRRFLLACWMLLLAALPAAARTSPEIPGIAGAQRRFAVFLIEDHGAMREVVWDAAFTDSATAGFFTPNRRYAIRTTGTPGLVDLGCWDEAWPQGEGWKAGANVVNLVASPGTNGFILTAGGKSTWLPNIEAYDGRGTPMATFRGAYLNWLLANRGTAPSIPAETRWERARRGILGVARELLTRPTGGEPIYRIAGIGTSDALLIPPGEGLSAAENAIAHMEPSTGGSMEYSLSRALTTAENVRLMGGCSPGIVFVVGDGITGFGTCGAAKSYATAANYVALQTLSGQIAATKRAGVWTWDVEGPDAWTGALANPGFGRAFSGDAITPIKSAIQTWKASIGTTEPPAAPLLTLGSDPASPTNRTSVNLLITVDRPVASATLNGQAVTLAGLTTPVPVTLVEGPNVFTVSVTDGCAKNATASTTLVLDTAAPVLVWTTPPPTVTTATTATLAGTVDDPTALLTLNGQPLEVTGGAFSATVPLTLGGNPVTVTATDPAGNATTLSAVIVRVLPPRVMTVTAPADGTTTTATSIAVSGSLSEPGAAVDVNGVAMTVSGTSFSGSVPLERGDNVLVFSAYLPDGRSASDVRTVKKPLGGAGVNGAPVVTITFPMDGHGTNVPSILVKGRVDDPTATVVLQGQSVPVDANGLFERTITSEGEGTRKIAASATNPYGTHETAVYVHFDWTPPVLTWIDPTPAAGARLTKAQITATVGVNEPVLADINGRMAPPEPQEGAFPYTVQTDLTLQEGAVTLVCLAADRAGNRSTISRSLAVGLTAPVIAFDTPAFEGGTFRTVNPGVTLTGSVTAPDVVKPLIFQINGQAVALDATGRFTSTMSLESGSNAVHAEATNAFGQKGSADRTVVRVQADPSADAPSIQIDSPLEGFATGVADLLVKGRVNKPGLKVKVAGLAVPVDPLTLRFVATVKLVAGPNTITAMATDVDGRTATATVHGSYVVPGSVHYLWTAPAAGARSARRTVAVAGQADLPGVSRVTVNGVPMGLTGSGSSGAFNGEVSLGVTGRNSLLLEVWTLAGEHLTERRDVIFEPQLPKVRLDAPVLARPGETIEVKVSPEPGTTLVSADLSWNGRLLAHMTAPWDAVQATVPADALPGARIPVEALGTDDNGETVTVRSAVEVRPGGAALLVEAFDDRTGLPLVGGSATLEGGETRPLDASARTSFATYQPTAWLRLDKVGYLPVWRSAALQVATASAVVDARPTAMDPSQDAGTGAFTGTFAGGSFELTLPSGALGATGKVSLTPLTTQGLPALLPSGWSAVSALWFGLETATLNAPGGTVKLTAPAGLPTSNLAWVRWDAAAKTWKVLATGLASTQLDALPLPAVGGYALVAADPAPVAPPAAVLNDILKPTEAAPWREGLKASGLVDPSVLPTSAAIAGARATARLVLDFDGGAPIPSGAVLQADLVESYVLVDQGLIEPEVRSSDAVAARYVLNVDAAGKPALRASSKGLDLELPVRMSRTFAVTELVEGLIRAAFYRDGLLVATGGGLIGPDGGSLTQDGITLTVPTGALSTSTFARILPDAQDQATALWPELAGQGRVARSFQVELAGALSQGLSLSLTDLGSVPAGVQPILVQRRVIQGQRQILAVGALAQNGSSWTLSLPAESNPILEGGAFAVLVPSQPWAWVTGTATMPGALAQAIQKASPKSLPRLSAATATGDAPVMDAIVSANYLKAASGAMGIFAVPAFAPASGPLRLNGERWDLGVNGSLDAAVPSSGNALRLATVPFRILTVIPAEGAEVGVGASFNVVTSSPVDEASLGTVKLMKGTTEATLRRSLSLDGRTLLLIPERPLDPSSAYSLVAEALKGLSGEVAPNLTRSFHTSAAPAPVEETADFSKIRLSYPDESFNVTITIPTRAVPPRCGLSIEAPGMGSSYTGAMPASGDHTLTLRASLGERLTITVQFPSGKTMTGFLSRYEGANGRVVIGIDGGRIEAADGSGAAVVMPFGAVEYPTEFQAFFSTERPADIDQDYANEQIVGRIDLKASRQDVEFKFQPIFEFPAPTNPNLATNRPEGMGPYAIYVSAKGWEADGSPASYYELRDSARVVNGKLIGFGGLPGVEWETWSAATPMMAKARPASVSIESREKAQTAPVVAAKGGFLPLVAGSELFGAMTAMTMDGGPIFLAGGVTRVFESAPDVEHPVPGAPVFAVPVTSTNRTLKLAGRLIQTTNNIGRYFVEASTIVEIIGGSVRLMSIDPEFGVSAFSASSMISRTGIFGNWTQAPTLKFNIYNVDIGDRIAPWGRLKIFQDTPDGRLEVSNYMASVLAMEVEVAAYDLRDKVLLSVSARLDGLSIGHSAFKKFARRGDLGIWTFKIDTPTYGRHVLEVEITDKSGNTTRLTKQFAALDFPEAKAIPGTPPDFSVNVDPIRSAATPDTFVQIQFSELVAPFDREYFHLERRVGSSWTEVEAGLWGLSGAASGGTTYFVPKQPLLLGSTYRVRVDAGVVDLAGMSVDEGLTQEEINKRLVKRAFTVGQASRPVAEKTVDGTLGIVCMLGKRIFAQNGNQILQLLYENDELKQVGALDLPGGSGWSGGSPDTITAMSAFSGVEIGGGKVADMLLVLTAPPAGDTSTQAVLWGYNLCENGNLQFGVSIGVGATGYSPSLDYLNGFIAVGRLSSSILLVDSAKAAEKGGWGGEESARTLVGANQTSIIQALQVADPNWVVTGSTGGTSVSLPSHWSVGLMPSINLADTWIQITSGFSQIGSQREGRPLSGLPGLKLDFGSGPYVPTSPYIAHAPSVSLAQGKLMPPADARAFPGLVKEPGQGTTGGFSVQKLATWVGANLPGSERPSHVVVGTSSMRPSLMDEPSLTGIRNLPSKGNSIVIMDKTRYTNADQYGVWPMTPPFGEQSYEVLRKHVSIDPYTGLACFALRSGEQSHWVVIDINNPQFPTVFADIRSDGFATMRNGILTIASGNLIRLYRLKFGSMLNDETNCGPCVGIPLEDPRLIIGNLNYKINDDPCVKLQDNMDCRGNWLEKRYRERKPGEGEPVDDVNLSPAMKLAFEKFNFNLRKKGLYARITSGYRSPSYQFHLRELYKKWSRYKVDKKRFQSLCPDLVRELEFEWGMHGHPIGPGDPTKNVQNHTEGIGCDINIKNIQTDAIVCHSKSSINQWENFKADWIDAGLVWPYPGKPKTDLEDRVHFKVPK